MTDRRQPHAGPNLGSSAAHRALSFALSNNPLQCHVKLVFGPAALVVEYCRGRLEQSELDDGGLARCSFGEPLRDRG